jgi:hypothetical protein
LKIFEIGEKFYFEDLGLRNSIRPFNYRGDIGKLMENAVYLHLLRNNYKVFVGKSGDKEIDFMAEKNGERLYVQVAYQLGNENIIQREFGNLVDIPDNYPKYVVTMDEIQPRNTFKGIRQVHLRNFLRETVQPWTPPYTSREKFAKCYSVLKLFTGFATAAFIL